MIDQTKGELPELTELFPCNRLPRSSRCEYKKERGTCPGGGFACVSRQSEEFTITVQRLYSQTVTPLAARVAA